MKKCKDCERRSKTITRQDELLGKLNLKVKELETEVGEAREYVLKYHQVIKRLAEG